MKHVGPVKALSILSVWSWGYTFSICHWFPILLSLNIILAQELPASMLSMSFWYFCLFPYSAFGWQ